MNPISDEAPKYTLPSATVGEYWAQAPVSYVHRRVPVPESKAYIWLSFELTYTIPSATVGVDLTVSLVLRLHNISPVAESNA